MGNLIQTCVSLDPSVKNYLERIVKNPNLPEYKKTYSSIINFAMAAYAAKGGETLNLEPVKKRGRPGSSAGWRPEEPAVPPEQSAKVKEKEAKAAYDKAMREWQESDGSTDSMPKWFEYRDA